MRDEDNKMLKDLDDRLASLRSRISDVNRMQERLDTLYKIRENGVNDLRIDIVGNYGSGSYNSKPELDNHWGTGTGIPRKLLDEMIGYYETNIKIEMNRLTSTFVVSTYCL